VAPGCAVADEMRVGLRGMVRRVWGLRGVKVVQPLQLRYEWRALVLAVDGLAGRLWWRWTMQMNMKALSLAPVVAVWQQAGLPGIVWDGAGDIAGSRCGT